MSDMMTLTLPKHDVLMLALGLSDAAMSAHLDDRLLTASAQYELAAKLFTETGHPALAACKRARARCALEELAAAKVDDEEDAEL